MREENGIPRRNDIGQKILIGLILGGFGTTVGFFVNTLIGHANAGIQLAEEAKSLASDNRTEFRAFQAEVRAQYVALQEDMGELKSILRRTTPSERNGGR